MYARFAALEHHKCNGNTKHQWKGSIHQDRQRGSVQGAINGPDWDHLWHSALGLVRKTHEEEEFLNSDILSEDL